MSDAPVVVFPDTLRAAILEGSVVIRRVSNGWLLQVSSDYGDVVVDEVFEDGWSDESGSEIGAGGSLVRCLWSGFSGYMRTKRGGGLVLQVKSDGFED